MDLFQQEIAKEIYSDRALHELKNSFRLVRHLNTTLRSYSKHYPTLSPTDTYEPILRLVEKTSILGEYLVNLKYFVPSSPLKTSLEKFNSINLQSKLSEDDIRDIVGGDFSIKAAKYLSDIRRSLLRAALLFHQSFDSKEFVKVIEMIDDLITEIDAI